MRLLLPLSVLFVTKLSPSTSFVQPNRIVTRSYYHYLRKPSVGTMASNRVAAELFSSTSNDNSNQNDITVHRILCYGDSLTAGTSSSPWELYPYAPHLERALNMDSTAKCRYVVRHRGMPGWLASAMVESANDPQFGLQAAISGISNPSLSCVIIMAGTNDLGYAASQGTDKEAQDAVLTPIRQLHEMAWTNGVPRTIAIAIPPSGYQSAVTEASRLATAINQELKAFCQASNGKAVFVEFPFDYVKAGDNWSPDGLHFSPQGYQVLGEYLKEPVSRVLDALDAPKSAG